MGRKNVYRWSFVYRWRSSLSRPFLAVAEETEKGRIQLYIDS